MPRIKCDLCAKRAVYHDTIIEPTGVKVRHLCRRHGYAEWQEAQPVLPAVPKRVVKKFQKDMLALHRRGQL